MSMLENMSHKIARRISAELSLDKGREEVIAYGAFGAIHTGLSVSVVLIMALVLNVFFEAVIILAIVMMLRRYTGGVHASSPTGCSIMSGIFVIILSLMVGMLQGYFEVWTIIMAMATVFVVSLVMVYKHAPVESPNKPIFKKQVLRLRRGAFVFLAICILVAMTGIFCFYYTNNWAYLTASLSISQGVLWQSFTLTKMGHVLIKRTDMLLHKKSYKREGRT